MILTILVECVAGAVGLFGLAVAGVLLGKCLNIRNDVLSLYCMFLGIAVMAGVIVAALAVMFAIPGWL